MVKIRHSIGEGLLTAYILFLTTMSQTAISIYMPSMPAMVEGLHTHANWVQLSVPFYMIAIAFSQLIYGPLSDKFGRRGVLLHGLVIYFIGSIFCTFAPNIQTLLAARLAQGIGAGAFSAIARAMMRDSFKGKKLLSVVSYTAVAWSVVPIAAPVIGGYIQAYLGWRFSFAFLMLSSGIFFGLVFFTLPETLKQIGTQSAQVRKTRQIYFDLFRNSTYLGYVISVFMLYGIFVAYDIAAPFLLQTNLGFTPVQYGWISVLVAVGYLLATLLNGRLIHKYSMHQIMIFGLTLLISFSFVMMLFGLIGIMNAYVIVIPIFLIFFSTALIYPNCIAGSLIVVKSSNVGTASALFGFLAFTGASLSGAITARLPEYSQLPVTILIFSLSLLACLSLSLLVLPKKDHLLLEDSL